ncbi:TPA: site-specific DNA-methyltransferase [Bacillus cereus]|uniref:DNA methyltransferase n=1 Tax=Bacillus TaxID=1386 RepID=UPI0008644DC4|nr:MULTISPECIES: site-specific DNA-methyltransferase [Bacillus]ASI76592.1 DNA methylase [Bacillus cereus]MCP1177858.1 site-specific DNA-methyltransferase [Bacillus sp. 1663tsa1]MCP1283023.1 site-specific DNA-methyltransferase [Bacillus sp. S0635]MCQ6347673.1 site-specific DNA-methyltransferase [Bacillus cereus]MCU5750255.1 site-specific DNA-methyltransferase [Bacillus cereus]
MNNEHELQSVEDYKFEPIKGYPMLNWKGKRPYTSTQYYPAQLKESYGNSNQEWMNKIFWGDNLQVMSHLLKEFRGRIDLVYIDPPFDSKADYKKKIKLKKKQVNTDLSAFEEKQYGDIWSNDEFLQFMYERIILIKELLSDTGTLYVHCDWHKSGYLRCILDEIFGPGAFKNEVIWHYYNKMQGNINRFASNHDNILVYTKSDTFTFNKIREKREKPVRQIKRVWDSETQSLVNAKDEDGKVIYIESTHKTVDDVWRLSMLQPADKIEPTGYPTQKPEALIQRIIEAATNPGDIVFDCFMGSGTTQAVALKTGRRFIGADINLTSVQTTTKRLLNLLPEYNTGLEIFNVNNYEMFKNPSQAKDILLEVLEVQQIQNSIYDGEKDGQMVKIMPINRIATKADLNNLITNLDYKVLEERQKSHPNQVVEDILLVCMGHEPDLAATLKKEIPYKINVEVVDILRDRVNLEFKRDAEARIKIDNNQLIIQNFYPMNLLQKLSIMKENIEEWKELVESVMIDWNYDGAILEPSEIDIPSKEGFVKGVYNIPEDAGTIRVKITDILSESLEVSIENE